MCRSSEAMDAIEPNQEQALGDPDHHHQGMSPNIALAAVREVHGGDAEANQGDAVQQEAVAVRTMAMAVTAATGSPGSRP